MRDVVTEIPPGYVSITFTLGEEPYVFTDAIVLTQEEYDSLTPEQIAAMEQQRYDDWYAIVTAPPEEVEAPSIPEEVIE